MGWFRHFVRSLARSYDEQEKVYTVNMGASNVGGVEYRGEDAMRDPSTIKITKATNGYVIEYSAVRMQDKVTDPHKDQYALEIAKRNAVQRYYVVPEGTDIATAIVAVVALMKLQ